jgi:hypothetical protein
MFAFGQSIEVFDGPATTATRRAVVEARLLPGGLVALLIDPK